MTTSTDITAPEKQKTITINRTIDLPLTTVWKAWTDPEDAKKWWGPEGFTSPDNEMDFRVGGKYLNSMVGPDGKKIWSTGTFEEIISNEKIVYSDKFSDSEGNEVDPAVYGMEGNWGDHMQVTVTFNEVAGKTNISLEHTGLPEDMAEDCIQGWQQSFDKLEREFADK